MRTGKIDPDGLTARAGAPSNCPRVMPVTFRRTTARVWVKSLERGA